MPQDRARFLFLNLGHGYAHFFMLLYPTVVLALEVELGRDYGDLLLPSTAGFVAFAAGTLPAGWLGDRCRRTDMLTLMFFGLGAGSLLTALAVTPWQLAGGLAVIGLFAAIYHPVGIAMVVESAAPVGRALGINGVFGNLGVAAGPITAGVLSELFGWRAAFAVPGAVALATGLAFVLTARGGAPAARIETVERTPVAVHGRRRVIVFLAAEGLFGGLVFHAVTVALPKLMDQNVGAVVGGPAGAGALASLIFACAAFAQIAVGRSIDRHAIRTVALSVIALQVPLLVLTGTLSGWACFAAALGLMLLVFGAIPIGDTLVAHYSSAAWRARLYAFKYILSLGVSAAAVPMVAVLHHPDGGFVRLFILLALFMVAVTATASALPAARRVAARPGVSV